MSADDAPDIGTPATPPAPLRSRQGATVREKLAARAYAVEVLAYGLTVGTGFPADAHTWVGMVGGFVYEGRTYRVALTVTEEG